MNLSFAKSPAMGEQEMQTLSAGARCLARQLSELSQSSVAARWLVDLEFMVWQDLVDRHLVEDLLVSPEGYIFPRLDEAEKEELRQLSQAIGGWIVYDPEDTQDRAAFVPLADWATRFEAWLERTRFSISQIDRRGQGGHRPRGP